MATRFFLRNVSPPYSPATKRGAWSTTAGIVSKGLSNQKIENGTAATNGVAEAVTTNPYDVLVLRFVSYGLLADVNFATTDTVQWIVGSLESNSAADMFQHVHIFVTAGDSDTVRGTLLSDNINATELPTTAAGQGNGAINLANNVSALKGDRIVIELGYRSTNTVTTSRTGTFNYGNVGLTDLTSTDVNVTTKPGWFEFSKTFLMAADIVDTFTDNSMNTDMWGTYATVTTVSETGGFLTFVTSTATGYAGYTSMLGVNLIGSKISMELYDAGNQALASLEVVPISLAIEANNRLFWYVSGGTIAAYKVVAGTQTQISSATYNATTHKFLQIREASGTVYFEYSSTGASGSWSTLTSLANPFTLTNLQVEPSVGHWQVEASGTTVKMRNLNVTAVTTTKTATGVSRITAATQKTMSGVANIINTGTFGTTTIGGSSANTGNIIGSKYTATQTGWITSITVYAAAVSGTANIGVAVYSDSAGAPNAFLTQDFAPVSVNTTPQWVTVPIRPIAVTVGDVLWLYSWASASRTVYWNAGSANQYSTTGGTFENWPDPMAGVSYFARAVSIYANWTVVYKGAVPPTLSTTYNGTTEYTEDPDNNKYSVSTTGELTISAWIKLTALDSLTSTASVDGPYVHFMGKGVYSPTDYEYAFRLYDKNNGSARPNRISFYLFNTAAGLGAGSYFEDVLTTNTWIHVVGTVDASNVAIWKNAIKRDEDNYTGTPYFITPTNGTSPFRIGTTDKTDYFYGTVGDVRVYSRKLTASEIYDIYNGNPTATGLVAQFNPPTIVAATTRTMTGVARIKATTLKTETGVARIKVSTLKTETGVSRLQRTIGTRYNYIVNPSFETNDLYWGLGGGAAKAQTYEAGYMGAHSLKFTGSAVDDRIYFASTDGLAHALVGHQYTFSVYLRGSGQLKLWVYDGGSDQYSVSLITLTSTWTRYSLTVTCAADTTMYMGLRLTTANAVVAYMDAAQFEQNGSATPYFDGTTPGASWTGSAHNSTSSISGRTISGVARIAKPFTGWPTRTTIHVGSQSMDVHTNTQAQIDAVVAAIVANVPNADFIAIGTYLDYAEQIAMWADSIHRAGKKMWLRSAGFNDWQGQNSVTQYTSSDFAAHSTTQFTTFVNTYYAIFKSGDIFSPVPDEPEENTRWNIQYTTIGSGAGKTAFNTFFTDAMTAISGAFSGKGVSGVETGIIFTNASVMKDVVTSTTAAAMTALGTDDYPEISSTTPEDMENAMLAEVTTWINPGNSGSNKEITFGPNVWASITEANQADAFRRELNVIKANVTNLVGITIWQFGAVGNAPGSRIFDESSGVWTARSSAAVINTAFITATRLKTETGVARIQKAQQKTETGVSRITAKGLKTATGVARIQKSALQTLTGVSRIQKAIQKTETGVARVTVSTLKTENGVSRITSTILKTETGVARIKNTILKTMTGIATIVGGNQVSILGRARIQVTQVKTETGVAKIILLTTRTLTGVSRITAVTPKTMTGVARITNTDRGASLITNGLLTSIPALTAPMTGNNGWKYIDGTATGNATDQGYAWGVSNLGTATVNFDNVNKHGSFNSLKIHVQDVGYAIEVKGDKLSGSYNTASNEGFALKPNTRYEMSGWIKSANVSGSALTGGVLSVLPADVSGNALTTWSVGGVTANQGWTFYTSTFTTPATAVRGHAEIRVYGHNGTGTLVGDFYFSEFKLEELGQNMQGVARIRATLTKTETGVARIQVAQLKTETGVARITASTLKTETGISRITKIQTKTETGVARITVSTQRTETGVARITAATQRTETGVARIRVTTLKTETGVSRIRVIQNKTETGIARIQKSATQTETGISRILKIQSQTETGLARIRVTMLKTLTGVSRITKVQQKTETGVARIKVTNTKTETGIARIEKTVQKTMTGVAKISITVQQTIIGKANIKATTVRTMSGVARIGPARPYPYHRQHPLPYSNRVGPYKKRKPPYSRLG